MKKEFYKPQVGCLISFSLIWLGVNILSIQSLFAEEISIDLFIGNYKGNVEGTPLGLGNLKKTGSLTVEQIENNQIKITSSSALVAKLSVSMSRSGLEPYFNSLKKAVRLDDGQVEERVSFMHHIDDNYGFFNKWFAGLTSTVHAYQFKFVEGAMTAFRIQKYNTGDNKKSLYLLEVRNVEKIVEKSQEQLKQEREDNEPDERKDDWTF